MVCYLLDVLITTEILEILSSLGLIKFFSALFQWLLEFVVVSFKIDFSLPYWEGDLLVFYHVYFALVTHDNVLLNGLFNEAFIDDFLLSIFLNFTQNRPRDLVQI